MVKNLPANAGGVGLIFDWGTRIPHGKGQLSLHAATTESEPKLRPDIAKKINKWILKKISTIF